MRTKVILLVAVFGVAPALGAQDAATDSVTSLKASTRVELALGGPSDMVGAVKCDGFGDLYARPVSSAGGDYFLAPIRQVTPEGRLAGEFRLADAWRDAAGRGIFADRRGNIYQAAIAPGGVYVVEFAKDGSVKSKAKLHVETYVDPWHLAVFESGRFLVSGETGKNQRTPYTAVFDADGKLVKRIYEPEDEDARSKAELGDAEFTHNDSRGNNFTRFGDVTLGSDGNVYLLHGASPTLVYVISSAGQVIRKMRIGTADSEIAFRGIKSYASRLAIGLARSGHVEVRVTNLEGSRIGIYTMNNNEADGPTPRLL